MGKQRDRRSSLSTLFEIRAHRRTWRLVLALLGVAGYLAASYFLR